MQKHEDIDIVYLWVHGADPAWQARRARALQQRAGLPGHTAADHAPARYGDVAGRYRDNGELRYNLRALERFFPGHGHIYIVTDGQTPAWLRPHAGLSIVDHRDLLPAAALPVFDSGHIESYLHHIPSLAERFIYLNDDVFFGAPVDPGLWFGPQGLALFMEAAELPDYATLQPHETALVNAALLSRDWLGANYPGYRHRRQVFAHAPRPMLVSLMHQLERAAPELFAQVRSTVFRSWRVPPLVPDLAPRWMLHTGRAVLHEAGADAPYLSSGAPDAAAQFALLRRDFGAIPFFCINDTSDDAAADDPQLLRIAATLQALLPLPSRFEGGASPGMCCCKDEFLP